MFPSICRASESGIERGPLLGQSFVRTVITSPGTCGSTLALPPKLSDKGWIGFSRSPHSDADFCGEIIFDGKKIQRRTAGIRCTGAQLRIPPPQLLALDARYFPKPEGGSTLEALVV